MKEEQIFKASYIANLIIKCWHEELSETEAEELNDWLEEDGKNFLLYDELQDMDAISTALYELNSYDTEAGLQRLRYKIQQKENDY